MNKLIIFILFIIVIPGYAQNSTVIESKNTDNIGLNIDSIVFNFPLKNKVLSGTCILPGTDNQQIIRSHGLLLDSVNKQNISKICSLGRDEILYINMNDSSLIIKANTWGNSCHEYLCDVSMFNDSILNIIAHGYGYGSVCSCKTNHLITYKFKREGWGDLNDIKYISFNGRNKISFNNVDNVIKFYLNHLAISLFPDVQIGNNPFYIIDGIFLDESSFREEDLTRIKEINFLNSNEIHKAFPCSDKSSCIIVRTN